MRLLFIFLIYLLAGHSAFNQTERKSIVEDKEIISIIKEGINLTYNFSFREAEKYYDQVQTKYPNHPAYSTLMALNISYEFGHSLPGSTPYQDMMNHLNQAIQQSEALLAKDPNSLDGIFFALQCHSMLAYRHSLSHDFLEGAAEAKKTYKYMKQGMKRKNSFSEFYFSSGIYNYFREQYPETHIMVRPLVFFFEPGNKTTGIADLEKAVEKATFTKIEAQNFLSRILIKYENKPLKAAPYTKTLHEHFPNNLYFTCSYIETSMINNHFEQIEPLLQSLLASSDEQYIAIAHIFYGYYYEKTGASPSLAKANYIKGLNELNTLKRNLNDFKTYAYMGLARVYLQEKNAKRAFSYYKEAEKTVEYTSHRQEIDDYLKK